ncbi:hypothetical protein B0O95_104137 [Mycetohabitans endofungorum]|uniref:Uncharacterized protein n=1 Tax=Mycetohabitans endofungorum TaxID=417203 RepID=A0A2P5KBV3_9BURK|nr:hypothetical protein B0O95_104137 [Mycetohabitans endofungorum]
MAHRPPPARWRQRRPVATETGCTLGAAPQHGDVLCYITGASGYGTGWSSTALTLGMFCAATRIALISLSDHC